MIAYNHSFNHSRGIPVISYIWLRIYMTDGNESQRIDFQKRIKTTSTSSTHGIRPSFVQLLRKGAAARGSSVLLEFRSTNGVH